MYKEIFSGETVSLIEMLDAREERYVKQQELLAKAPECSLLVVTMNIPGDVKNSSIIQSVFDTAINQINQLVNKDFIRSFELKTAKTGNEAFYLINMKANDLKQLMLEVEETHPQGRLFDLDVLYVNDQDELVKVSRDDFDIEPRRCFVCNKDAKGCARSRAHTTEEMKEAIASLIANQ